MTLAYVGLGGNLGNVRATLEAALRALDALPATQLRAASRLYRTPPWGLREQPPFLNAVAALETGLAPLDLLDAMLGIERGAGRSRDGERWGPRTLDLDLLLYGERCIDVPGLCVPHPRLAERAFALVPLAELAPQLEIPGQGPLPALLEQVDRSGCEALPDPA